LKENEDNIENYEGASEESTVDNLSIHRKTPVSPNQTLPNKRKCYASKCQLLKATGIIPDTMFCTTGRNMCSGCTIEMHKQAKTAQLEREICLLSVDNHILQPVLSFRSEYMSKTKVRRALSCLPTFNSNSQDDSIFGAARYLANTIGILIQTPSSLIIDQPMTIMEKKQMWRKATFFCRCTNNAETSNIGVRSFWNSCFYLIPYMNNIQDSKCPGCRVHESWEHFMAP
jgi:hypothetical protein